MYKSNKIYTKLALLKRLYSAIFVAASLCLIAIPQTASAQDPSKSWAATFVASDSSGESAQNSAPHFDYQRDLYENLDYSLDNAANADIELIRSGLDDNFLYIELTFAAPVDSSSQTTEVGIEIDVDHPAERDRGDFFFALNMRQEFESPGNSGNWIDTAGAGGFAGFEDANNSVGGSSATTPDQNPGDGFESPIGVSSGRVYARIKRDSDSFEIAIRRSLVDPSATANLRIRAWSAQAGTDLTSTVFSIHDHFGELDIPNIDSFPGAEIDEWTPGLPGNSPSVDIEIGEAFDSAIAIEGATVVITTRATLLAGQEANGVLVDAGIPAGLTHVSSSTTQGSFDPSSGAWEIGSLITGADTFLTVTATVDSGQRGELIVSDSTLEVLEEQDFNEANNSAAAVLQIAGSDGSIEFVADLAGSPVGAVLPGDDLFVKVSDADLNNDSAIIEQAYVVLRSFDTEDFVSLVLTETGADSALFTGSNPTQVDTTAIPSDNLLQVTTGDTVTAFYVDQITATGELNIFRTDQISFTSSAPAISLVKNVDKTSAPPGTTLTYQIAFNNSGSGEANALSLVTSIPGYTTYIPDSMRIGPTDGTYESALTLTDANDGSDGAVNGSDVDGYFSDNQVRITIDRVLPNDGTPEAGSDSGKAYFQVIIQ